jgi:hypothetical protein
MYNRLHAVPFLSYVATYFQQRSINLPSCETMARDKTIQDDENEKRKGVEQLERSLVTATEATNSQRSSPASRRSSPRLVPSSVEGKARVPSDITPSKQLFHDGLSSITDTPSKVSGKKRKTSTPGSGGTKSSKTSKVSKSNTPQEKKKSARGRPKRSEEDPYETEEEEQQTPSEESDDVDADDCLPILSDLERHTIE